MYVYKEFYYIEKYFLPIRLCTLFSTVLFTAHEAETVPVSYDLQKRRETGQWERGPERGKGDAT